MWDKLTIRQFQDISKAQRDTKEDGELAIRLVSILNDITETEVEGWTLSRFNAECKKLAFLSVQAIPGASVSEFNHNGKRYHINYRIEKNSYGQYLEIMNFAKNDSDIVYNLDKIMATIVTPIVKKWYGWGLPEKREIDHVALSNELQTMPFIIAYHSAVFFYHVLRDYLEIIRPYLEAKVKGTGLPEVGLQILMKDLDGCIPQKRSQGFWESVLMRSLKYQYGRHSTSLHISGQKNVTNLN